MTDSNVQPSVNAGAADAPGHQVGAPVIAPPPRPRRQFQRNRRKRSPGVYEYPRGSGILWLQSVYLLRATGKTRMRVQNEDVGNQIYWSCRNHVKLGHPLPADLEYLRIAGNRPNGASASPPQVSVALATHQTANGSSLGFLVRFWIREKRSLGKKLAGEWRRLKWFLKRWGTKKKPFDIKMEELFASKTAMLHEKLNGILERKGYGKPSEKKSRQPDEQTLQRFREAAQATVDRHFKTLAAMLNFAESRGPEFLSVEANPWRRINRSQFFFNPKNPRDEIPLECVKCIIERMRRGHPVAFNAIIFAAGSGRRMGEVVRLYWTPSAGRSYVDLRSGKYWVKPEKKGEKGWFPLSPLIRQVIEAQMQFRLAHDDRVFPLSASWVYQLFKRAAGEEGYDFTPHQLRHSFASWLREFGEADVAVIQGLLAHRSIASTQNYDHGVGRAGKEAAGKVSQALLEAGIAPLSASASASIDYKFRRRAS